MIARAGPGQFRAEFVGLCPQLGVFESHQLGHTLGFRPCGGLVFELASDLERLQVQALELAPEFRDGALGLVYPSLQLGALLDLSGCAASSSHPARL